MDPYKAMATTPITATITCLTVSTAAVGTAAPVKDDGLTHGSYEAVLAVLPLPHDVVEALVVLLVVLEEVEELDVVLALHSSQ